MSKLMTIGDIARAAATELHEPVGEHRIRYIIDHHGIAHSQKIGNLRAFTESAARKVIAELRRIQTARLKSAKR